jgi:hypothetical protein
MRFWHNASLRKIEVDWVFLGGLAHCGSCGLWRSFIGSLRVAQGRIRSILSLETGQLLLWRFWLLFVATSLPFLGSPK